MERVLAGHHWEICLLYIDDIIIFSKTVKDHLTQLDIVFFQIEISRIKAQTQEGNLFRKKVQYLVPVVSDQGIKTDPEKTIATEDWPVPHTVKEIKSFLGLCFYYR